MLSYLKFLSYIASNKDIYLNIVNYFYSKSFYSKYYSGAVYLCNIVNNPNNIKNPTIILMYYICYSYSFYIYIIIIIKINYHLKKSSFIH